MAGEGWSLAQLGLPLALPSVSGQSLGAAELPTASSVHRAVGDKGRADAGQLLVWVCACLASGLPLNAATQRFLPQVPALASVTASLPPPRCLQVLDSIYFSRRFHVRCVARAVDKAGHAGTPLRSNVVTIGTDSAICHTPVVAGTARGFQAQSFIATLKYLDVKHKEHPNRYEPGWSFSRTSGSRGGVSEATSRPAQGALWNSVGCSG